MLLFARIKSSISGKEPNEAHALRNDDEGEKKPKPQWQRFFFRCPRFLIHIAPVAHSTQCFIVWPYSSSCFGSGHSGITSPTTGPGSTPSHWVWSIVMVVFFANSATRSVLPLWCPRLWLPGRIDLG